MKKRRLRLAKRKHNAYRSPYAKIDWEKAGTLFQRPSVHRSKNSLIPATREVLHVLAAVGAIGLTFALPGAGAAVGAIALGNTSYSRWGTRKILDQLAKQKYVTVREKGDITTVVITKRGMQRALTYQLDSMTVIKQKRWDRKWRVVIFDVPEKYKGVRDMLRMRMRQMGLFLLQESVYVSPYPCFDEVEFLRELFGIAFSVRYLLVQKVEDDQFLREHFEIL